MCSDDEADSDEALDVLSDDRSCVDALSRLSVDRDDALSDDSDDSEDSMLEDSEEDAVDEASSDDDADSDISRELVIEEDVLSVLLDVSSLASDDSTDDTEL